MFDSSDDDFDYNDNVNSLKVDWIDVIYNGESKSVALSSLPGCRFQTIKQNLLKDLDQLEQENITDVVVLVTNGEMVKYRVPHLVSAYDERGLNVHHYPFTDGTSPPIDLMMSILLCLKRLLDAGKKVLVHCMGGLGRACVVLACLMLHLDDHLTPKDAIELLRAVRGPGAVQTVRQYNFIYDFRDLHHQWLVEDLEPCVSR